MTLEVQILLTAIFVFVFTPALAQAHWIFALTWLAAVPVIIIYAVKLIWGI